MPPRISGEPPLSLQQALAELGQSREAVVAAAKIAAAISQGIGRPESAEVFAQKIKVPRDVAELMSVRVGDLVRGFKAAQTVTDGRGGAVSQNSFRMPQRVNLKAAAKHFDSPHSEPKQLGVNFYSYSIPSGIPAEELKMRSAFGEILDRLALNPSMSQQEQFCVVFGGCQYWSLDHFIDALVCTGHEIEMDVSNEVANFLHLWIRQADGTLREVQTDVRIRTGYFTSGGDEIVTPAVHSHLIFRIAGPHVTTAVEFYQGTHGTHFNPSLAVKGQSWVGIRNSATVGGQNAVRALKAAGLYLELLQKIGRDEALFAGGYGQIGVCNDSVAMIEVLLNGKATVYPLLIDKKRVLEQLGALMEKRPGMAARYREIGRAIREVPSDFKVNGTQPQRILASIPYGPGQTPHAGFNDARRAFAGEGATAAKAKE